jgi:membrane protease YdiL (CAAX protease family)
MSQPSVPSDPANSGADTDGPVTPPTPPATVAGRRPWSAGEISAWVVVLVLAACGALLAMVENRAATASPGSNPGIVLAAKLAFCEHEWSAFAGDQARSLEQLEKVATSPEDRLRLAILSAELKGREQALERLQALAGDNQGLRSDAAIASELLNREEVAPEAWRSFREKYGWFADLARTTGQPAGDGERQAVVNAAAGTVAVLVGLVLVVVVATAAGLVLLIVGIVLWSSGRIQTAFGREDPDKAAAIANRSTYVQGMAWYMFVMVVISLTLAVVLIKVLHWDRAVAIPVEIGVQIGGLLVGLLWPRLRGQSASQWRAALGLHRGRGVLREMGAGIVGYLAGLPVLVLGVLVTILLTSLTKITPTHPVTEMLTSSWMGVLGAFLLASVWAPMAEELMFRGALFAHVRERFGWWIAAPVVGVIFAIIHPQTWVALPALGALAIVFCGIREWRGSIIGCMTAHALHNAAALTYGLLLVR